jgi:integral membrane sensor domain MASE1
VFERVRLARALIHFAREHLPGYGSLLEQDLQRLRDEMIEVILGAGISISAGLIFCCFLSVAVLVTAWDGPHRTLIAWVVCSVWGVLALAGAWIARRAFAGPTPFRLLSRALSRDYATFIETLAVEKDTQAR